MDVLFSCKPARSMEKEEGSVRTAIVSMEKQRIFMIWMACLPSGRMRRRILQSARPSEIALETPAFATLGSGEIDFYAGRRRGLVLQADLV